MVGQKREPSDKTQIFFYFKPIVTKSMEKHLYTWRNLFAEIGGYVGIFLGYSFVSLVESILGLFKLILEKATSMVYMFYSKCSTGLK